MYLKPLPSINSKNEMNYLVYIKGVINVLSELYTNYSIINAHSNQTI